MQESKAVAYYCRTYAMDQGMLLRDATNAKEVMPFLIALMDRLEQDKQTLPVYTPAEGKALVQSFADKVFTKADEVRTEKGGWQEGVVILFRER
jgi:vacuolar protein sorting-associated protein VTA1